MRVVFDVADFEREDEHRLSGAVVRPIQYKTDDTQKYFGEPWIIGSITPEHDAKDRSQRWVLVSLLDGLVIGPSTPQELVNMLNKGNGYIRVSKPLILGREIQEGNI